MSAPECMACGRPARAVTLVRHSAAFIDPERATWEPNLTCESVHRSEHLADQVLAYDKDAELAVFDLRQQAAG